VKLSGYDVFLITIKVLDASRRSRLQRGRQGATTEAYGAIRRKEERSKATPQMMPWWWIRARPLLLTPRALHPIVAAGS